MLTKLEDRLTIHWPNVLTKAGNLKVIYLKNYGVNNLYAMLATIFTTIFVYFENVICNFCKFCIFCIFWILTILFQILMPMTKVKKF